jgi:Nickel responsive protein SCO4226-like
VEPLKRVHIGAQLLAIHVGIVRPACRLLGFAGTVPRGATYSALMPVFMIERRFADELEASAEAVDGINRINDEEGVRWLYSFLSADKRKTYCLYEAPSPEAIRRAATRAGLPADVIVEVTDRLTPDGAATPL